MSSNAITRIFHGQVDLATERGRGHRRIRRMALTAIASIGFRGIFLISSFLYIPVTVHYLGPERYGLWVAMTSVITLLSFADCGLGYSLMNDVAYSLGRGKEDAVRAAISTTFFALGAIAVLGCVLFAAAFSLIPWQAAFQTKGALETSEAARATAVIVLGFLLTLPFTTVQRVQSAHQEGYKTQAWEIGGVLLSVLGLLATIRMRAGLPVLAFAFSFGPLFATVVNWIVYFGILRPAEFPRFQSFHLSLAKRIVREGGYFLILQVWGIVVFSTDSFILLHYFGQAAFGKYSLVFKLFQVAPSIASVWLGALWPAYAEAIARKDLRWVRSTLIRSTLLSSLGCGALSVCVALLARPIIRIWTGVEVAPSFWLLAGLTLFSVMLIGTSSVSMYLAGSKYIKEQALLVLIASAAGIVLRVVLCKYGDVSGAVWGTNLAYILVIIPAYCVIVPRLISKQHQDVSMCQVDAG